MQFFRMFFVKIGRFLLVVVAAFRRALCCFRKRRRLSDVGLPVTSIDITTVSPSKMTENCDLQDWEVWNEGDVPTGITIDLNNGNSNSCRTESSRNSVEDEESAEDFFQDMTPSIRRPKKYAVKGLERNEVQTNSQSSYSFSVQAPSFNNPELGYLDDQMGSWEDVAPEDMWDPEAVLREQKLLEREKRLAEHQRRKKEKEAKRLGKVESFSAIHS